MPSSPALSKDASAPTLASRWSAAATAPWSRLLALQILQVTSLSITFSLAYDFPTLALLGGAGSAGQLPSARDDGGSAGGGAGSSGAVGGGTKAAGRARKKKGSKGAAAAGQATAASHQPQRQHQQHQPHNQAHATHSDTEFEDADDPFDGHDSHDVGGGGSSGAGPSTPLSTPGGGGGHVHYPLYQRGSELLGSSPMDLGESSTGGGGDGRPHFATLLSKGLAVTVNGSPWRSVAAHVIEGEDEAVVVIYGLSPGRDYAVELGLVGDEEGRFDLSIGASTSAVSSRSDSSSTVHGLPSSSAAGSSNVTSAHSSAMNSSIGNSTVRSRSRANSLRTRSRANSTAASAGPMASQSLSSATAAAAAAAPSASAAGAPHPLSLPPSAAAAPAPALRTFTSSVSPLQDPDAALALLKHQLAQSQAQHAHLASELKSHRRTSQKSEAALRANITALQKAAEKNSVGDLRARQKALALGESVKRLIGGKEDVDLERERLEAEVAGVAGEDDGLEELERTRQREWEVLRGEAEEVEKERDEVVGSNERLMGEWEAELGALLTKLDKLNTKHDRLTSQISTFHDRLDSIAGEKAEIASGTHPVLRDAALSFNAHSHVVPSHRSGADHGPQQSRGRPPPMSRGGGGGGGSGPSGGGNMRGGAQWKAGPSPRGGQVNANYPPDALPQHAQGSSTSPLQISAAPFRPQHNHAGPHQYHRSSPSFTVQNPHALVSSNGSPGVNSHAQNAQSSFLAAHAQADPYSAVFADRDDAGPTEPAAFPPLPSAAAGLQAQGSPSPSLAHQQLTPGSYSLAAVASKPFAHHHHPAGARPTFASFSSASPQSSPALASAQLVRQQQQSFPSSDGFPPLSPVGSVGTPSRKGSLGTTPTTSTGGKGTPDAAERAAHIPLPLSPSFDHD